MDSFYNSKLDFLFKNKKSDFDNKRIPSILPVSSLDDIFIIQKNPTEELSKLSILMVSCFNKTSPVPDVLFSLQKLPQIERGTSPEGGGTLSDCPDETLIGSLEHPDKTVEYWEFNILNFDESSNIDLSLLSTPFLKFKFSLFTDIKYIYDSKTEYIVLKYPPKVGSVELDINLIYNNYFTPSVASPEGTNNAFKYIDITKTNTPEVYTTENDFLYIPDIKTSKYLKQQFLHKKSGQRLNIKCIFNSLFKKWQVVPVV
jgi:hypothetical protein